MRRFIVLKNQVDPLDLGEGLRLVILRTPDAEHPYLETADITLPREFVEGEQKAERYLEAVARGQGTCTDAGTWGDYDMPGADIGGHNHFLNDWGIRIVGGWFKSGNDHGFPRDKFFDERLIHGETWLNFDSWWTLMKRAKAGELDMGQVYRDAPASKGGRPKNSSDASDELTTKQEIIAEIGREPQTVKQYAAEANAACQSEVQALGEKLNDAKVEMREVMDTFVILKKKLTKLSTRLGLPMGGSGGPT